MLLLDNFFTGIDADYEKKISYLLLALKKIGTPRNPFAKIKTIKVKKKDNVKKNKKLFFSIDLFKLRFI